MLIHLAYFVHCEEDQHLGSCYRHAVLLYSCKAPPVINSRKHSLVINFVLHSPTFIKLPHRVMLDTRHGILTLFLASVPVLCCRRVLTTIILQGHA